MSKLVINDFNSKKYEFLSNFYPVTVEFGGLSFLSSEAAFQAQKCETELDKEPFTWYLPIMSKMRGKKVALRPDWEDVKLSIMEDVVRAKFTQNTDLAKKLVDTGDAILIEGNVWHDTYWGVDTMTGKGENHLGIILMKIRDELRERE